MNSSIKSSGKKKSLQPGFKSSKSCSGPAGFWEFVLDNYGLTQHVAEPTHNKGHTLDLIISKGLNISKVVVTDVALSDHSCVFFESSISVHKNVQNDVTIKLYSSENTKEMFMRVRVFLTHLPSLTSGRSFYLKK